MGCHFYDFSTNEDSEKISKISPNSPYSKANKNEFDISSILKDIIIFCCLLWAKRSVKFS